MRNHERHRSAETRDPCARQARAADRLVGAGDPHFKLGAKHRAAPGGGSALHLGVDYPPSATSMTVCYGFVCRRRHVLDFSAGDRAALTQLSRGAAMPRRNGRRCRKRWSGSIAAWGRSSAPPSGWRKRISAIFDENTITIAGTPPATPRACCWFCRNGACCSSTTSATPLPRQRAGAADAAQHRRAGRARHQNRVGGGSVAARLSVAARCHDRRKTGGEGLNQWG